MHTFGQETCYSTKIVSAWQRTICHLQFMICYKLKVVWCFELHLNFTYKRIEKLFKKKLWAYMTTYKEEWIQFFLDPISAKFEKVTCILFAKIYRVHPEKTNKMSKAFFTITLQQQKNRERAGLLLNLEVLH